MQGALTAKRRPGRARPGSSGRREVEGWGRGSRQRSGRELGKDGPDCSEMAWREREELWVDERVGKEGGWMAEGKWNETSRQLEKGKQVEERKQKEREKSS